MKTGERTKVQISINFDTNYGIRRIAANDFISEDESEMEEATTTSETASSAEDSDHEIYVFQQDIPDNVNLISDISDGNLQILASEPEISTTSKTRKEDLIKAIEISISKVPLKYAGYVPEL